MKTPTMANHLARPCSIDFIVAQAPSAMSRTSRASGLLKRNIRTATGVSAMTAPPMRPAAAPKWRLTVGVDDADGGDPHQHLGHEDAERAQPEHPHRQGHRPTARRAACRR